MWSGVFDGIGGGVRPVRRGAAMKIIASWLLLGCLSGLAAASEQAGPPGLTAEQIVEKNIAARGGLDAWRKIQSMVWIGHIESSSAPAPSLPFLLEMKRPNKTRFEITLPGQQRSVRAYDASNGWKLRTASNGRPQVQPYTLDELRYAHDGQGIDGPLMDHQAKGVAVALEGVEEIEGHKAYRLTVTLASGAAHHVWIDAQNFLDIKSDREARSASGHAGAVSVYYRNYQAVDGLPIPMMIETGAGSGMTPDKMVIDKVMLNPPLADRLFALPTTSPGHSATAASAGRQPPARPVQLPSPDAARATSQSLPSSGGGQ
jgi:hypothetical protein